MFTNPKNIAELTVYFILPNLRQNILFLTFVEFLELILVYNENSSKHVYKSSIIYNTSESLEADNIKFTTKCVICFLETI